MKKIYNIFVVAISCIILVACDNYDYTDKLSSVKVISAKTTLPAAGGTENIAVKSDNSIKVYAKDKWLDVSCKGDSIQINAPENVSQNSRHTEVVIKSGNDSTIINASQYGIIFHLNGNNTINCDKSGGSFSYKMKCNVPTVPIKFNSNVNWISGKYIDANDSLCVYVLPNTTGQKRNGYLTYTYGSTTDTVKIVQSDIDKKDFEGIWKWKCSIGSSSNDDPESLQDTTFNVNVKANATGDSLYIAMYDGEFTLHGAFNDGKLVLNAGDYLGESNALYVYLCLVDWDQGYFTWKTSYTYTAVYSNNSSQSYFKFEDNGCWSGYTISGLDICSFAFPNPVNDWLVQEGIIYMINPVMYRDK